MDLEKRFVDLSKQANRKGFVLFSDFLTLGEQQILKQNKHLLETDIKLSGGYSEAERQMVAFIPDALFSNNGYYNDDLTEDEGSIRYPYSFVNIKPTYVKFADKLTHRDILGALMNQGIERNRIGDIIVNDNPTATIKYGFFACNNLIDYLREEFTQIKHTVITIDVLDTNNIDYKPKYEEKDGLIASNRLDAIISAMTHVSRSEALRLISAGKISINGIEVLHNTYNCKENDVISVRGYGKFRFCGETGMSRKDKIRFKYLIYS